VKLISKNSNLCDHNPPTSQTDGQTDGQTDRHAIAIPRFALSASRDKNDICCWLASRHSVRCGIILARDRQHSIAIAYMLSPVRQSVCLSHGWISRKRFKLWLCNFHRTV